MKKAATLIGWLFYTSPHYILTRTPDFWFSCSPWTDDETQRSWDTYPRFRAGKWQKQVASQCLDNLDNLALCSSPSWLGGLSICFSKRKWQGPNKDSKCAKVLERLDEVRIDRLRLRGKGVTGGLSRHRKLRKAPGRHSCSWWHQGQGCFCPGQNLSPAVTRGERDSKGERSKPLFPGELGRTGTDAVCGSNYWKMKMCSYFWLWAFALKYSSPPLRSVSMFPCNTPPNLVSY